MRQRTFRITLIVTIMGIFFTYWIYTRVLFFPAASRTHTFWYLNSNGSPAKQDDFGAYMNMKQKIYSHQHCSHLISEDAEFQYVLDREKFVYGDSSDGEPLSRGYYVYKINRSTGELINKTFFHHDLQDSLSSSTLAWYYAPYVIFLKKQFSSTQDGERSVCCEPTSQLLIYEKSANNPYQWEKIPFKLPINDPTFLIDGVYSEKWNGFFTIWKVSASDQKTEKTILVYYNLVERKENHKDVTAMVPSQIQMMHSQNFLFLYGDEGVSIYSIPELKCVKNVCFPETLSFDWTLTPITVSSDLRYIAYGDKKVFVLEADKKILFVLDPLYSNRWDVLGSFPTRDVAAANTHLLALAEYYLTDMKFIGIRIFFRRSVDEGNIINGTPIHVN